MCYPTLVLCVCLILGEKNEKKKSILGVKSLLRSSLLDLDWHWVFSPYIRFLLKDSIYLARREEVWSSFGLLEILLRPWGFIRCLLEIITAFLIGKFFVFENRNYEKNFCNLRLNVRMYVLYRLSKEQQCNFMKHYRRFFCMRKL